MFSFLLGALLGYFGIKATSSFADRVIEEAGLSAILGTIIKIVLVMVFSTFVWLLALIVPIRKELKWGVYAASIYKVVVILSRMFKISLK